MQHDAAEESRIEAVTKLGILGSGRDEAFDAIVRLAADVCGTPISLVTILDASDQWFKASIGTDLAGTPRNESFCDHAIRGSGTLVVEDATRDPRFADLPMVACPGGIRFYAGVPLVFDGVNAAGALCVKDVVPRRLSAGQLRRLEELGTVASTLVARHADLAASAKAGRLVRRQAEEMKGLVRRLRRSGEIFDVASALAGVGFWQRDLATGRGHWTQTLYDIYGTDMETVEAAGDGMMFHPEHERVRIDAIIREADRTGEPYEFEAEAFRSDGTPIRIRAFGGSIVEAGKATSRYGLVADVTEEHAAREAMRRLAERDDLTGLLNRRTFIERVDAGRGSGERFLLLIDLDGFKEINDSIGHAAGDHVLRTIGTRLERLVDGIGFAGRVGGDEFAVLVDGDHHLQLADAVVSVIENQTSWNGRTLEVGASVGAAPDGPGSASASTLLADADLALHEAKARGKGQAVAINDALRGAGERRFRVLDEVRAALGEGRMELHYQPRVDIAGGGHDGFEALIRMRDVDGTLRYPGSFREALDDPRLGAEIGRFVVEEAAAQAAQWLAGGVPFRNVAVNLGAVQFRDGSAADLVLDALARHGLPHSAIEVEVTEDVFLSRSSDSVLVACRRLKDAGVAIAFDDFGTGHASLSHVAAFPLDVVKIDRSFVASISEGSTAIVDAVLGIARSFGLKVVAEGVETVEQEAYLRRAGCGVAQGFLWSAAIASDDVPAWLGTRSETSLAA